MHTFFTLLSQCGFTGIHEIPRPWWCGPTATWISSIQLISSIRIDIDIDLQLFFSRPFTTVSDKVSFKIFHDIALFYCDVIEKHTSKRNKCIRCVMSFKENEYLLWTIEQKLLWFVLVIFELTLEKVTRVPVSFVRLVHTMRSTDWIPRWIYSTESHLTYVSNANAVPVLVNDPYFLRLVDYDAIHRHFNLIWKTQIETNNAPLVPCINRYQYYSLIIFTAIPLLKNLHFSHWSVLLKTIVYCVINDISLSQLAAPTFNSTVSNLFESVDRSTLIEQLIQYSLGSKPTVNDQIKRLLFCDTMSQESNYFSLSTFIDELRTMFKIPGSINPNLMAHAANIQFGKHTHIPNEDISKPVSSSDCIRIELNQVNIPALITHSMNMFDFVAIEQIKKFTSKKTIQVFFLSNVYAMDLMKRNGIIIHECFLNSDTYKVMDIVHYTNERGVLLFIDSAEAWIQQMAKQHHKETFFVSILTGCIDADGTYDVTGDGCKSYENVLSVLHNRLGCEMFKGAINPKNFIKDAIEFIVMQVIDTGLDNSDTGPVDRLQRDTICNLLFMHNETDVYMLKENVGILIEYAMQWKDSMSDRISVSRMFPEVKTLLHRYEKNTNPRSCETSIQFVNTLDRDIYHLLTPNQITEMHKWLQFMKQNPGIITFEEKWFTYRWLASLVVPIRTYLHTLWDELINVMTPGAEPINQYNWDALVQSQPVSTIPTPESKLNHATKCILQPINSSININKDISDIYSLVCAVYILTDVWKPSDISNGKRGKGKECIDKMNSQRDFIHPIAPIEVKEVCITPVIYNTELALNPLLVSYVICEHNGIQIEDNEKKWEDKCSMLRQVNIATPIVVNQVDSAKPPALNLFNDLSSSDESDSSDSEIEECNKRKIENIVPVPNDSWKRAKQ